MDSTDKNGIQTMRPAFPVDVLRDILSRLPLKILGEFIFVSKEWLRIITDPKFLRLQSERCLKKSIVVARHSGIPEHTQISSRIRIDICALNFDGSKKAADFFFHVDHLEGDCEDGLEMLSSKGELICFVTMNRFYVCNPTTQVVKKLPQAISTEAQLYEGAMGYFKDRHEYVFAHLFYDDTGLGLGCQILRLRDGEDCEWKMVDAHCRAYVCGSGVCAGDVFYWKSVCNYNVAVVSFDLKKEEFGTIAPPQGYFDPDSEWSLVELGGRLCFVDRIATPDIMEIWVLKDPENHTWSYKYCIEMTVYPDSMRSLVHPVELFDDKVLLDAMHEGLDSYSVTSQKIKKMGRLITGKWNWLRLYTPSFFKFLVTDPNLVCLQRKSFSKNLNVLVARHSGIPKDTKTVSPIKIDICALKFDGSKKIADFSFYIDHFEGDYEDSLEMLPSKGDLVCFVTMNRFYVCNPTTQVVKKLPQAISTEAQLHEGAMGYFKDLQEYVFAHIFYHDNTCLGLGCEILRLRDGEDCEWKVVDAHCRAYVSGPGVFAGNIFYWKSVHDYNIAMVSFDLENEEFGTVAPPQGFLEPDSEWSLVELGGRLCFVDRSATPDIAEIWVLKDPENHAWSYQFCIEMNVYPYSKRPLVHPLQLLDEKILLDAGHEGVDYYCVKSREIIRMDRLIAGEWSWLRIPSSLKL